VEFGSPAETILKIAAETVDMIDWCEAARSPDQPPGRGRGLQGVCWARCPMLSGPPLPGFDLERQRLVLLRLTPVVFPDAVGDLLQHAGAVIKFLVGQFFVGM
jgi:hypothetical protein